MAYSLCCGFLIRTHESFFGLGFIYVLLQFTTPSFGYVLGGLGFMASIFACIYTIFLAL
jgi:hypothetical protein